MLNELGQQARRAGRLEHAQALLEEAHVLWRQAGIRMGERAAVMNLALVASERGMTVRSAELACYALELSQDMDDTGSATAVRAIEIAAQILWTLDQTATAVSLVGAAASRRDVLGAPLPVVEQPDVERVLDSGRAVLGAASFDESWHRGQSLPIDDALHLAAATLMTRPAR